MDGGINEVSRRHGPLDTNKFAEYNEVVSVVGYEMAR